MYEYKSKYYPFADELLDSDVTPVDKELQDTIPGLLKAILAFNLGRALGLGANGELIATAKSIRT